MHKTGLWQNITYITDVSSFYIFEIQDKKYFFFGDQHFSKSAGGCEEKHPFKCDDFDYNFKDQKYYGTSCTSIGVLLHNWFTYNNNHCIKTDFYLEHSYTKSSSRQDVINLQDNTDIEHMSWLFLVRSLMHECFVREKTKCPYYPYVHAHYADIRALDVNHVDNIIDPFIFIDLIQFLDKQDPKTITEVINIKQQIILLFDMINSEYGFLLHGIIDPTDFDIFLKRAIKKSSMLSRVFQKYYITKLQKLLTLYVMV
jgi:hypothetical protein